MDFYLLLKLVHILGATVLFGTGIGIAFFMVMAHRSGDPGLIAATACIVVIADAIFTATAAIVQPLSGLLLVYVVGYSFGDLWVWLALLLYMVIGACWLPVVWIQIRIRDIAAVSICEGAALGDDYHRLMRIWFILGWPAFIAILAILVLMVWKPVF